MEVVLLKTEGRGRAAEIEVDGHPLRVVDGLSVTGEPLRPGPLCSVKLELVINDALSWERARALTLRGEKKLEQQWGWRYLGHGQVTATSPVCVDLGSVTLAIDLEPGREVRAGEFVTIAIDRIILSESSPELADSRGRGQGNAPQ